MPHASFADRIQDARPRLSKSFQRLADYILDSYVQAALMTASELAHEIDVDSATVVRFAQALDYSGFPELQNEIKARVLEEFHIRAEDETRPDSLAVQVDQSLGQLAEAIERARRVLAADALEQLVAQLSEASRVLLLPDAPARSAAHDLQRHLAAVGILALVLDLEENALAAALAAAAPGDLLLALDMSGASPLTANALKQAAAFKLGTAALVGGASFQAARQAGVVLETGHAEGAEAASVVLAALVNALGAGLRWQQAKLADQIADKMQAARKGLSAKV
jgi:DNA-binding MurR/RpiR family transcriptional regulator